MSQLESVIPLLEPLVLDWTANGRDSLRAGYRSPYTAPHSAYLCRGDDSWCVIASFSDEEGKALCHCLGDAQRVTDPRFDTLLGRKQNEDELDRLVAEWTSGRSAEEVMTNFQSDGVSSGSVLKWEGLVNDPQLGHRGHHVKLIGSDLGVYHVPNWGFRLSDTPPAYRLKAPISGSPPNLSAAASWAYPTRSSLSCWPTAPSNSHPRLATL